MNEYYVYAYLDIRKERRYSYGGLLFDKEPFYIGKGKNNRYKEHLKESSKVNNKLYNYHFYRKIRKIQRETKKDPEIIILAQKLNEKDALDLETKYIKLIGRKNLKLGPLCNLTDGGEGLSNPPEYIIEKKREKFKKLWKIPTYRDNIIAMLKKRKLTEEHKARMLEGLRKVGWFCSEEMKVKISAANKGHLVSDSCRKKLSNFFKGRVISEEVRSKISSTLKGRKLSDSTKKKLSVAFKGRYVSEETRKKMSIAFTGRRHTPESKLKMSKSKKGRKLSEETKNKLSLAMKGKKRSPENRKRNRLAALERWRRFGKRSFSKKPEGMLASIPVG